ncbi:MmcQ/YjbR family DNA-binding protein [Modestobacter marinus]|uniref:MmcQ/YjbR family DNA-binding protein n=1 Tax=Modestobacter marinus TaxID=477641 RepID=UPI001C9679EB|nr:MmcQ/YjbR family DNA-binding protein [Modestobacter marinus]
MTVHPDEAVAMLLALPGVTEADHHGRRSFRVGGGSVVATVPAEGVLNVMVGEEFARAVTSGGADGVSLLWWGTKLSGVRVELADVDADLLDALVDDAWRRRAPKTLRQEAGDGT